MASRSGSTLPLGIPKPCVTPAARRVSTISSALFIGRPSYAARRARDRAPGRALTQPLLLEEVVERAADVVGTWPVGGRVTLDGDPEREGVTGVGGALVGDPLDDGLGALEATARLEVGALAAGVDRGAAVWALRERAVGD